MTISTQTRSAGPFSGTGIAVVYPFAFKVFQASDLLVVKAAADGTQTTLALSVDYTVILNADQNIAPGGTLTLVVALPVGSTLAFTSNLSLTQGASLTNAGGFFPKTIEDALDRLTILLQQQGLIGLVQALRVPEIGGIPTIPTAPSRAGNLLGFDSLGNPVAVAPVSGSAASLAADLTNSVLASKGAGQIGFGYALAYGASTIGNWLQSLVTSVGASVIGWVQAGTGAVTRLVQDKLRESVSVLDFIPVSEHAAIKAYTSTLEVSDYFNAALAAYPVVRVPAGQYRCTRPINLSARRSAFSFWGRRLIGEGANATRIDAYTGVYPCIDATGQNLGAVMGINFRSDNPPVGLSASDCASIGLKMGRGNVSQACNQLYLFDLRFNMTSDMTRNAGNGTIGICNEGSEHLIRDQVQIYANLPLVDHNVLQFAVSLSSNIPTFGVNYEQPYIGAAISCTIHESRNMQLIAWDSFRAIWLHQVGNVEFPNLYTSTRKLVSTTPAQLESFYFTGSCANVLIRCYQEVSGLFGATYLMDHRYLTIGGINENINILVQRAALDQGFANPGVAQPSVQLLASATLNNSDINCNYLLGIYTSSSDNNGFTALPVAVTGVACLFRSVKFTLDHSGSHSSDIFPVIGPYCTNVDSINYFSGENYFGPMDGTFTPVVTGLTIAGAGTYTTQIGTYRKAGRQVTYEIQLGWSAHTGTGAMSITGLPFTTALTGLQTFAIDYDGLVVGAGKQASATAGNNGTQIFMRACDPAGGAVGNIAMDSVVNSLTITGSCAILGSI